MSSHMKFEISITGGSIATNTALYFFFVLVFMSKLKNYKYTVKKCITVGLFWNRKIQSLWGYNLASGNLKM